MSDHHAAEEPEKDRTFTSAVVIGVALTMALGVWNDGQAAPSPPPNPTLMKKRLGGVKVRFKGSEKYFNAVVLERGGTRHLLLANGQEFVVPRDAELEIQDGSEPTPSPQEAEVKVGAKQKTKRTNPEGRELAKQAQPANQEPANQESDKRGLATLAFLGGDWPKATEAYLALYLSAERQPTDLTNLTLAANNWTQTNAEQGPLDDRVRALNALDTLFSRHRKAHPELAQIQADALQDMAESYLRVRMRTAAVRCAKRLRALGPDHAAAAQKILDAAK